MTCHFCPVNFREMKFPEMETYEKLLEKAYSEVKVVGKGGSRFEIPKVEGHVSKNNTIITNILQIASYLRRDVNQIVKFLQKELAVFGKLDKSRLILKTKLNSSRVNEKVEMYAKDFVICPVCGKPDTEITSEKGVKLKHCLACGAKSPIKYHL
jgi:translation initiation factor 2 subunit 2